MAQPTLTFWLSCLENLKQVGDGYTARCPAHDDVKNSLKLTPIEDDEDGCLIYCYAGCTYRDLLRASNWNDNDDSEGGLRLTSQTRHISPAVRIIPDGVGESSRSVSEWWEEYIGVPSDFSRSLGVQFGTRMADGWESDQDYLAFTWPGTEVKKRRAIDSSDFDWIPPKSTKPPLWPRPSTPCPEHIWLTEGESDCIVLRWLGFLAFGITRGAGTPSVLEELWPHLKETGLRRVTIVADQDSPGKKFLAAVTDQLKTTDILTEHFDLSSLLDPTLGEKDLRDVWVRTLDRQYLRQALLKKVEIAHLPRPSVRLSVSDLLAMSFPPISWTVQDMLLRETVGLIVGPPKLGKSWLALALAVAVSSGAPFLGKFQVHSQGAVVYISKEDPPSSTKDRISKILAASQLSPKVSRTDQSIRLKFAPKQVDQLPFFLDLSKTFVFSDQKWADLIVWLDAIAGQNNGISMIVFDPLLRMMVEGDEYRATDVNRLVFEPSVNLTRRYGASVVFVHHRSKSGPLRSTFGSIAFEAFADSFMYLDRAPETKDETNQGWIQILNSFRSAPEFYWQLRFSNLTQTFGTEVLLSEGTGVAGPESSPGPDRRLVVVEALSLTEARTVQDLCRRTGLRSTLVSAILAQLLEDKLVAQIGKAGWKLA